MSSATAVRRGYVDVGLRQMHFRRAGNGAKPLILLHQAPASSWMWSGVMPALARQGFDAIAFDLPGYGLSDPWPHDPELEDYADAVALAATALGLDSFDVCGHHTGCGVAMLMSVRHAPRIRRVVGWGIPRMGADWMHTLATEPPPEYGADGAEIAARWLEYQGYRNDVENPWPALRTLTESLMTEAQRPLAHRSVGRADLDRIVDDMAVPMLALAGANEMLREETRAAAARSEHITYQELGDAGMFVADEQPELLADTIAHFLEDST